MTAEQIGNAGPFVLDTGGSEGREAPRTLHDSAATVSGRGNAVLRTVHDPAYTVCDESHHRVDAEQRTASSPQQQVKRRLSPAECALLQGWPEVIPALERCRTKGAQYRVAGNAVAPQMAEALGRALLSTT